MKSPTRKQDRTTARPFVGVTFECCNAYARVYLNADGSAFAGHCPRCTAPIRIRTGPGGSKSKFWRAG